jgi:hypothetical protein
LFSRSLSRIMFLWGFVLLSFFLWGAPCSFCLRSLWFLVLPAVLPRLALLSAHLLAAWAGSLLLLASAVRPSPPPSPRPLPRCSRLAAVAVGLCCLVACRGFLSLSCPRLSRLSCGLVRRWWLSALRLPCVRRSLLAACGLFGLRRPLRLSVAGLRSLCGVRPVFAALLSPRCSLLVGRFPRRPRPVLLFLCSARGCWPALGPLLAALLRLLRLRLVVAGFLRPAPLWCLPVCSVACWVPASRLRVLAAASGLGVRCPAGLRRFRRRCFPLRSSRSLPLCRFRRRRAFPASKFALAASAAFLLKPRKASP